MSSLVCFPLQESFLASIITSFHSDLLWIIISAKLPQQRFFHMFPASNRPQRIDTTNVPLSFIHNESISHV
ncbi:hypothetical protein BRARA_E00350 [Brassica rapa]|uniref:Uncharacterized protein n=1 Tax=Brassica campestris TaxID=3711 RepID=A0A397Z6T5_BRACM|nr:hypothetical protein BRARA_E00350 [Brassica rapa]